MYRYAQINEDGIVLGTSQLSEAVESPLMIQIESDFNVSNKKYVDGEWIEYIVPQRELSNSEKRAEAYATMLYKEDGSPLIQYGASVYTVDSARIAVGRYKEDAADPNGEIFGVKASELGSLKNLAKIYIDSLYPDTMTMSLEPITYTEVI